MAFKTLRIDPKNGLYKPKLYNPKTDYKEYKAPKPYVPPPYKDPLRVERREYKGNFEIIKHDPFVAKPIGVEYREYKGPFTDPLTGKPYSKGRNKAKPRPVTPKEEVIEEVSEVREEVKEEPEAVQTNPFAMFGSSISSISRTLKF